MCEEYTGPTGPLWPSESTTTSQRNSELIPEKSIHWMDNWDETRSVFSDLVAESQIGASAPDIITLDSLMVQASTPVHQSDIMGDLSVPSPSSSIETAITGNGDSASEGLSPIRSGVESPPMESCWMAPSADNKFLTSSRVSSSPAANITPPEILFQIFAMLSPRDFDNARRTCSQWFRTSLHKQLLESMLKRAGWWDAWRRDCQSNCFITGIEESLVWRLSRRFSSECLLSGRKVNVERSGFLPTGVVDFSQLSRESLPKEQPGYARSILAGPSHAPRLTAALRDPAFSRSLKFSVSSCGHFVLVATGCMLYVYHLRNRKKGDSRPHRLFGKVPEDIVSDNDLDILPISSIGCPYEILSATIDTSTPKFVIAALLRGRIGMICDIKGAPIHTPVDPTPRFLRKSSTSIGQPDAENDKTLHEIREAIASSATVIETFPGNKRPVMSARTISIRRQMNRLTRNPRKYYHDLCSAEDPPRSVSICPGRRCIAFGCGSGIELHWVDEKTQEDSRKFFPMSQPSEILHFLPQGSEIDETTKLRIISSLAGPGASGCQCHHSTDEEDGEPCQFHLSTGINSFTHWTPRKNGRLSLVKATHCHHYRAMPINDGLHILFIEPITGLLCIGSDAPIGGPTSLTQALICVPPTGNNLTDRWKEERVPTVFAAGSDLSWGLRIVAAYQDQVILYTVPLDVFNVIRRERERQGDGVMGDSDLARDWFLDTNRDQKRRGSLAQNQNGDWEFLLRVSYRPTAMMWPLKIYGKEIGRMDKIVQFSIQASHGGVRVWAFGALGEARIFDIDTCTSSLRPTIDIGVKSLAVASDGSIGSATLVDRAESGLLSPLPIKATRKRKQLSQPASFDRKMFAMTPRHSTEDAACAVLPQKIPHQTGQPGDATNKKRRPSFAACIVDFKIPELGAREGRWVDSGCATGYASGDNPGRKDSIDAGDFHDVASYDPRDIRRALLFTSSLQYRLERGFPVSQWH